MKRAMRKYDLPESSLRYVLESLVPYTDANLKISFAPSVFFRDLENIDRQKTMRSTDSRQKKYSLGAIKNAYYRAIRSGYIETENGIPKLTRKAKLAIEPYEPKRLGDKACIMVAFDIPEKLRSRRNQLRLLLKELRFRPVQQSLWSSSYDHRKILKVELKNLDIDKYVHVYEAVRID